MRVSARAAARAAVVGALTAAAAIVGGVAHAGTFQVVGVDSRGLAIQSSQPHVNHVVRYVLNGTSLNVSHQVNNGDQVEGRTFNGEPFTTWDQPAEGTWVYDWYLDTPTVGSDGLSPGIAQCGSWSVPPLQPGCVDWPSTQHLQTLLTSAANGGTGYAIQNGSQYGRGYHVNCNTTNLMNQRYALESA